MRKLMIAPSVGCCDLFHIEEQVKLINEKSDFLHMDIKDGVYVPSYGIGPDYLDYLNKHIKNLKPMDAHLMVKHPQQYLETFAKAGAAYITPHTDCIEGGAQLGKSIVILGGGTIGLMVLQACKSLGATDITVVDIMQNRLDLALKLGVNLIDTAPGYNFGNSEKILGKALEGMNREDVVIITKCGVTWDQEMKGDLFNKVNGIQLYKNLNSASIKREIEESLKRMGTDYVDVYMTHWQSIEGSEYYVPIQKTMEVLNDLKAQGKIKAIGAANVDIKQIEEYLKWGELDIVQAKYSILDRGIEDEIIPCCRENGVTIQAYSPLEMGLLSGTMPRDYKPVGAQIPKKWFQPENMQKAMDVMDQWKPLCEKYNCTIANLALAWILAQGDFINLLSGSTTVDQIAENVKSAELELEASDVAMMREMVEAIDKD